MKVLLVDDHPLYGDGFRAVLAREPIRAQVWSVPSADEALACLQRDSRFELVLIDVHLRGGDGFSVLRMIGDRFPGTPCIMISADEEMAHRSVHAGANGFIPKSYTGDQMIAVIEQVLAGEAGFEQEWLQCHAACMAELTPRQREVIVMLGQGRSNKEIARALAVAERTVKAHVSAIFELLGARNRTEAVLRAQRLGFLPPDSTPYAVAR